LGGQSVRACGVGGGCFIYQLCGALRVISHTRISAKKCSKSGQNAIIQKASKDQWKTEWQKERYIAKPLRSILSRPCAETGIKLYTEIHTRQRVAWLTRLRTGHNSLNQHLGRSKIVESEQCSCGDGVESVRHYLLICSNYDQQRDTLRRNTGMQGMRVECLLGDPKLIQHTLDYVEETERFNF
jgi:hypothetical protein